MPGKTLLLISAIRILCGKCNVVNTAPGAIFYYKILGTRNVLQMDRVRSKLVACILSVTDTRALTNTLAYYKIRTLQTRTVFIVEAPGASIIKLITAVIYGFRNKLECLALASLFSFI